MALKCFVAGLINTGGPSITTNPVIVLDSTTGSFVTLPSGDILTMSGFSDLVYSDTLSSVKAKLISSFVSSFNLQMSRTDGNTIQFVWLDDKGLL